jgi:hypothetical protein
LRVRARAMVECETVSYSAKKAQKDLEKIYFRKNGRFASAFEKSDCFIYIGEKWQNSDCTLKTKYGRQTVELRERTGCRWCYV